MALALTGHWLLLCGLLMDKACWGSGHVLDLDLDDGYASCA